MPESLPSQTRSQLVLEQRVPEGYSASAADHHWHVRPCVAPVGVTGIPAPEVFEHAAVLLALAPDRRDEEYRVVLVNTEVTGWVIA